MNLIRLFTTPFALNPHDPGLTRAEAERMMVETHRRGDRTMKIAVSVHFILN